jgi:hypothetical protein
MSNKEKKRGKVHLRLSSKKKKVIKEIFKPAAPTKGRNNHLLQQQ